MLFWIVSTVPCSSFRMSKANHSDAFYEDLALYMRKRYLEGYENI